VNQEQKWEGKYYWGMGWGIGIPGVFIGNEDGFFFLECIFSFL